MNQSASVYILQSIKSGKYYIGCSKHPQKRLEEHNSGKSISTKNKGPWILKLLQQYPTLREARRIENKLKKLKRHDYLEQIIKDGYIEIT